MDDTVVLDNPLVLGVLVSRIKQRLGTYGYVVHITRCWLDEILNNYVCELTMNGHRVGFAYLNGSTIDLHREVSKTVLGLIVLYEMEQS